MTISVTFKNLMILVAIVTMVVVISLVHSLAGLNATPVVFADPPAFF